MRSRTISTGLSLLEGLGDHSKYKAWKFPGGELHFILKEPGMLGHEVMVDCRINNSDDLILLCLAVETIRNVKHVQKVHVGIPYMPYQQADKKFSPAECFSLKSITNILNSLPVNEYLVFDPHSDVTAALLKNCEVMDNSEFIAEVLKWIPEEIALLSPDAGAYKKIFKTASKVDFKGEIETANKSRSISSGEIDSIELSKADFKGKSILIVDDICVGGRTFVELAKKLKERNTGNLYLAVSHGIFSNGFEELAKYFKNVYTTNSRADNYPSESFGKVPQSFLKQWRVI